MCNLKSIQQTQLALDSCKLPPTCNATPSSDGGVHKTCTVYRGTNSFVPCHQTQQSPRVGSNIGSISFKAFTTEFDAHFLSGSRFRSGGDSAIIKHAAIISLSKRLSLPSVLFVNDGDKFLHSLYQWH
ncbi:hypothetical protein VNO78_15163 [Psophocarpus tetragonolobus]|uniref:Uncharacterized protein n=1 Tax=Psophocarpus tetragonolobus TaxID=3891 RepID=A0AAN9SG00_PSOTE